jgi:hypothetical protein
MKVNNYLYEGLIFADFCELCSLLIFFLCNIQSQFLKLKREFINPALRFVIN